VADTQAATVGAADTLDAALIPADRSFAAVVTHAVTREAATHAAVMVTPAAVAATHAEVVDTRAVEAAAVTHAVEAEATQAVAAMAADIAKSRR
jgi:hypothetical protein